DDSFYFWGVAPIPIVYFFVVAKGNFLYRFLGFSTTSIYLMCKCAFKIFFGFFSLPFLKQCALTHHSKIGWFLCLKKCIRSRLADNKKSANKLAP
ncbi:hypothetical protein LKL81_28060, partial [Bacillus paranthracis]|uniref:hypothetical protein n=1 Tax=Bacillus paranthracis TaxID=2026186 RepID=UPI001E418162